MSALSSMSSDSDEEIMLLSAVGMALEEQNTQHMRKNNRKRRQWWVRPWIARREEFGAYHALMCEMEREDVRSYINFVRMDPQHFQQLLTAVSPLLQKQTTMMRDSILPGERLAVTLRFLASGDSYQSLSYLYRIGRSTLGKIIPETCEAIYTALKDKYLKVPNTEHEWETIANNFQEKWQFPNCIGAMDGKHIALKAPANSGSTFFNYKQFHSIILMAVVDAHYRVIMFDVGVNGRNSDAGVFASSAICSALEKNMLHIPPERALPGRATAIPHVIVGDEAFPLKIHLMKPYPARGLKEEHRLFNYRLSRARRVSENCFGILINRFAVLSHEMNVGPETATTVTRGCIALHNFLRTECDVRYSQDVRRPNVSTWNKDLEQQAGNRNSTCAREVREEFCDYFNTNGAVTWQWEQ